MTRRSHAREVALQLLFLQRDYPPRPPRDAIEALAWERNGALDRLRHDAQPEPTADTAPAGSGVT